MMILTRSPIPHPLLLRIGLLMAAVVVLGLTGMLSSIVIAQVNQGMATAVNQSGTLRMQSYRIGVAIADASLPLAERRERVRRLAAEFEERLMSRRLTDALPQAGNDPARLAYEGVRWRWVNEIRRMVRQFLEAAIAEEQAVRTGAGYLGQVDSFVDEIHRLVRVLEERAERRIDLLRWIQAIALALTLAVVVVTLFLLQRRVLMPLDALLDGADRIGRGDFSARTRYVGDDELGRVGVALNLMAQGLSGIYAELEERVADKTRDLARSNRSLSLLYRVSRSMAAPLTDDVIQQVLEDVRDQLGLAAVSLCLRDAYEMSGRRCLGTSAVQRPAERCPCDDCACCTGPRMRFPAAGLTPRGPVPTTPSVAPEIQCIHFKVGDQDHLFGRLSVMVAHKDRFDAWQRPLLESIAGHLATAINLKWRMDEGRRLALHEERSIIARELHDSLAQSLSYLKIQAARLDAALCEPGSIPDCAVSPARSILESMREGISSAYRQLRELLTTFRLRIEGQGFASALEGTAHEFARRADLRIELDDRLPAGLLAPNEEVHVMQIIREALSNVARHAGARRCWLRLERSRLGVEVLIVDDGQGLAPREAVAGHYGMSIMSERALTLGGGIRIERPCEAGIVAATGTCIRLCFRPRSLEDADSGTGAAPSDTWVSQPVTAPEVPRS